MALNTSIPNPNVTADTSFFQRFTAARAQVVTCPWDSTKKVYLLEIRSGEFTLNADRPGTGQPNGKNRTEALIGNSKVSPNFGFDPQEGDDTWMRWAIMVPTSSDDFGGRTGSDNVIMSQSNSYDSNHHGPGLTARFQTGAQQWVSYDGPTVYTLPKAQFTKGKVFDYMVHTHWSIGSSGYQEMWVKQTDGSWQQTSQGRVSGATLVQTNESTPRVGVYAKFGLYHQDPAAGGPWQLYHTGIRVGSARADVESLDLGTGGGVIINPPPPPPPVTRTAISGFLDAFNTTSRNQTLWPTVSGNPSFSNGQAVFLPTAAAAQQLLTSAAVWQMEGGTLEFRIPTPAAPAAGTVTVETRVVVYQDPVANSSVVVKVLRSTADPTGQLWVIFVNNGVEDTSLPLATGITYNAAAMLYGRIVVDSAGEVVTVATSPDKTTWTTRRSADPAWSFAGAAAQVQVGARITSGTGSVTPAAFDEVGTVSFVPPPPPPATSVATLKLPTGLVQGDVIVAQLAAAVPTANISNLDALPFQDITATESGGPSGTGVVTDTVRMWAFAKRYQPGVDTADWTVNLDASTTWSSNAFRISGADSLAADLGIDQVAPMSKNTAATSFVTDALDSPGASSRLYILAGAVSGTADFGAAPSGMTKLYPPGATAGTVDVAGYAQTLGGTAVTKTVTHGASVKAALVGFFVRAGSSSTVGGLPAIDSRGNLGATPTLDMTGKPAEVQMYGTLSANTVLTVSNIAQGQTLSIAFQQDATGGRTFSVALVGGGVMVFGASSSGAPGAAVQIPGVPTAPNAPFSVEFRASSATLLRQRTPVLTLVQPGSTPAVADIGALERVG